jgi:hypothetical protein
MLNVNLHSPACFAVSGLLTGAISYKGVQYMNSETDRLCKALDRLQDYQLSQPGLTDGQKYAIVRAIDRKCQHLVEIRDKGICLIIMGGALVLGLGTAALERISLHVLEVASKIFSEQ